MPANSILDGSITTLLSVLCILVEVLSHAQCDEGEKALMILNLAFLLLLFFE